jgi:formate hydrogenlyase transcriptional activator
MPATEDSLRLLIDTIPAMVFTALPDGSVDFVNRQWLQFLGLSLDEVQGWGWGPTIHPEDRARSIDHWRSTVAAGQGAENELRVLRADGVYRWILGRFVPLHDESGKIVKWYGLSTDIDDRKRAEEALRRSEDRIRLIIDTIPTMAWSILPDGAIDFLNQRWLDYTGLSLEEEIEEPTRPMHPEDIPRAMEKWRANLATGEPSEEELRLRRADGEYRWFLVRTAPLRDEQGNLVKWYGVSIDIEDRRHAEDSLRDALDEINKLKDQLYKENIALREEIVNASMFEEIIGTSPALQKVLVLVAKVAPTDSTVLISGETGTGKELIARAIHKRSSRAGRVFVSVNCAAVPQSLIASELFGHEKGAFTDAIHQRLGRFELAEGGTIFLDEIGELPAETQIALLRVLQEREFERVGGTKPIRADVRVIASTNRDLQTAIDAGTFRSDLFYRLNVFPIEMPPLRERKEDIPLLVEYFIHLYASKMGKKIRRINKETLDILTSYSWPGNIRELQNVIERSVILNETETFTIDKSWLTHKSPQTPRGKALSAKLATQEKEMIEAALAESGGRVSGPAGAAAKLGIPPSTLDSKITALKINKHRFKTS